MFFIRNGFRYVGLGLFCSLIVSCASTSQKHTKRANEAYAKGDVATAFHHTYKAIKTDINNSEALSLFPEIYKKVSDESRKKIDEAKKVKEWVKASDEFKSLETVNEKTSEVIDLINAHYKKQLDQFKSKSKEALDSTKPLQEKMKEIHDVIRIKVQSITKEKKEVDQKTGEIYYQKGLKFASEKKYREASQAFEFALHYTGSYKEAETLSASYKEMADKEDAEKHYEKAKKFAAEGYYSEAHGELLKTVSFVPGYKDAQTLLVTYKKAADEIAAESCYDLGQTYAKQGLYKDAYTEFEKAIAYVPNYKDAIILKEQYKKLADEKAAEEHYVKGKQYMYDQKYDLSVEEFEKSNDYVTAYKDTLHLIEEANNRILPGEHKIEQAVENCLSEKGIPKKWI